MKAGRRTEVLKLCHIAMGDLWAGAEVQLATLTAELAKRPGIALSVVLFNDGRLADEIRRCNVPVTVLPESSLGMHQLVRKFVAFCQANRFDLIHTHKYKDNLVGSIAAGYCGIPHLVRTIHGLAEPFRGLEAMKMRLYDAADDLAIRAKADRVVAVSGEIAKILQARYGEHLVAHIYNGVRLGGICPQKTPKEVRSLLRVSDSVRLIGVVGRLTAVKGHQHFLEALVKMNRRASDIHGVIVGDGPLRESLQSQAHALGLADRVHFVGHRDDTYDFMRALDVFVLPSLHEGIPMVLLEAMALTRPIVASRIGGIPEVVHDGVHGLLVPVGDAGALADACLRHLTDGELAARCAAAARSRVEQHFSSEAMADHMCRLYAEVIGTSAAAAYV